MGWWQLDYSKGDMRPQYDRMAQLYSDLTKAGLYIMPEGILTFSSHSCCGLHGGNIYAGDLLGYSYNTNIGFYFGGGEGDLGEGNYGSQVLLGTAPFDHLFRCVAHKRVPSLHFHVVPREKWDAQRVQQIKDLFKVYKTHRGLMQRRTVLKDDAGVLWENESKTKLFFSFRDQPTSYPGSITDAVTNDAVAGDRLQSNRAYLIR